MVFSVMILAIWLSLPQMWPIMADWSGVPKGMIGKIEVGAVSGYTSTIEEEPDGTKSRPEGHPQQHYDSGQR